MSELNFEVKGYEIPVVLAAYGILLSKSTVAMYFPAVERM